MHAFWLVLTHDLLEDRHIDDVIIKTFFNSLFYKTNRFQVPCVCSVIDHRGRQNVVRIKSLLLRDCRSLLKLDGNFVFSSIRVVVSSFEISWNSSCGTLIRSLASWKYIKGIYVKEFSLAVDE